MGDGALKLSRKAPRRGFVRILIGISSKMYEKVRRWLIKLHAFESLVSTYRNDQENLPVRAEIVASVCIKECPSEFESTECRVASGRS